MNPPISLQSAQQALAASETRFRTIFDRAAVGICVLNDDGIVMDANTAFQEFLGHDLQAIIGRHANEFSPPDDTPITREAARALRAGEIDRATVEKRFFRRDGSVRTAMLTLSRMPFGDGTSGLLVMTGDVTERRAMEAEVSRQRAFLAAVLEHLSDGVVACDGNGNLTLFNRALREIHGLGAEHVAPEEWASHYALYREDGETLLPTEEIPLMRAFRGELVRDVPMVIAPHAAPARRLLATGDRITSDTGAALGAVVVMRDVTEQARAEAALRESEARHRALLDTLPLVVYVVQPEPPYAPVYVSPGVASLGYTHAEWMAGPDTWTNALHPDDRERVLADTHAAQAARQPVEYEYRLVAPDGTVRWVHDRGAFTFREDGTPEAWHGIMLDVTARRAAEASARESEARVRGAVEASLDALYICRTVRDAAGAPVDFLCTDANARASALVGLSPDELLGRGVCELFPGVLQVFQRVSETGVPYEAELRVTDQPVSAAWIRLQVVRVGDGIGVTARDISDQKAAEETLRALALVDELTGVHNRRGFMALAEREWQRAQRENRGAVLAYIDLNDFKSVNDVHGHAEGDAALRCVADVLRAAFRGADVIGRLGGDEFAVLVVPTGPMLADRTEIYDVERRIIERLRYHLAASNESARENGRPYDVGMSIGTAVVASVDGSVEGTGPVSLASMMVMADERLYQEKRVRAA